MSRGIVAKRAGSSTGASLGVPAFGPVSEEVARVAA